MVKKRGWTAALGLLVVLTGAAGPAGAESTEAETTAVEAAETWLALIDEGKYDESWDEAAEFFRAAITKEQWRQALEAARTPLGSLESRVVKSTQYAASLPGAPDGEYVVIQFTASFANKESAVETVTPMKDPDGAWRVAGYFIK